MVPTHSAFEEAWKRTAVAVNGVYVPFNKAFEAVARFCRPFVVHNPGQDLEFSLLGSGLCIRVRGRNFLMSSLHQPGSGDERREGRLVSILAGPPDKSVGVTCIGQDILPAHDLMFSEFSPAFNGGHLVPLFWHINVGDILRPEDLPPGAQVMHSAIIGYPSAVQKYEPVWNEEAQSIMLDDVHSRFVILSVERAAPSAFDSEGLYPFVMAEGAAAVLESLDGLSGPPIISIWKDADLNHFIALAGMTLRANRKGRLNVLPADAIRSALVSTRSLPPFGEGQISL